MTLGSDIDVLLIRETESDDDAWEQWVTELARLITAWTGNDGRIVEFTDREFHAAAVAAEPLLDDVSKQGRTVARTRAWFTAQLRTAKRS